MNWVWRDCGEIVEFEMSSHDNLDFAYLLSNLIAWVIAKIKNKIPVELEAGPAQLLSGQKGGNTEWCLLFPISLLNTGNNQLDKYSVQVKVPTYLLKDGDDGNYSLKVDQPAKALAPGKSVLVVQLEIVMSKTKIEQYRESLNKDYILCTYEIDGFRRRERRLYLNCHELF